MALNIQAALAKDTGFRAKVEIAMVAEAETRLNAAQASRQSKPEWVKTTDQARRVLQRSSHWLDQFVKAVVADENVTDDDAQIKTRATSVWPAFSGVSGLDAR